SFAQTQGPVHRRLAAGGGDVARRLAGLVLQVEVGAAAMQQTGGGDAAGADGLDQGGVAGLVGGVDVETLIQQGGDVGGAAGGGGGAQAGGLVGRGGVGRLFGFGGTPGHRFGATLGGDHHLFDIGARRGPGQGS